MSIIVVIAAAFLAVVYLILGGMKLVLPIGRITKQMEWVHIAPPWQVRLVGLFSVLGAVGVIVPGFTGIFPWLSVLAALGLAGLQTGAIITHIRMGGDSIKSLPVNFFLFVVAVLTAVGYVIIT
jgi:hypothetical protein